MIKQAVVMCALALAFPSWAINKCKGPDGKVVFQDAPCMGQGEKIEVRPASGHTARPPYPASSVPTVSQAPAPSPAPAALPAPVPVAPMKSVLESQADQCLAWYRPLLRDPASAYYSEPKFQDKRVLRMTLHATNGFGGVVTRMAACEFDNGKLSAEWTKIQAKRLEWSVN
ncbi:DUF4124 domain-containing protein [Diaphorobacter nitroreducens]|uniref:DUF4124 domain-containing protein n=1 Tax=Diaphorobacter nitroreducens TaxID=164759 RepID=UPI0016519C82|nr:DUF4124 domain-containing protein [Diaphorobacter nitroreducens]